MHVDRKNSVYVDRNKEWFNVDNTHESFLYTIHTTDCIYVFTTPSIYMRKNARHLGTMNTRILQKIEKRQL